MQRDGKVRRKSNLYPVVFFGSPSKFGIARDLIKTRLLEIDMWVKVKRELSAMYLIVNSTVLLELYHSTVCRAFVRYVYVGLGIIVMCLLILDKTRYLQTSFLLKL